MSTQKSQADLLAAKYWQSVSQVDRQEGNVASAKVEQYSAAAVRDAEKPNEVGKNKNRLRI